MLVYSEKINQFTKVLTSHFRRIMRQELGLTCHRSRFEWNGHYVPFHIVLFEQNNKWGYFDPSRYQIALHRSLMNYSLDIQLQVLKHEMAHFLTFLKYGNEVNDHGPEFKEQCKLLGGNGIERAYLSLPEVHKSQPNPNQKILDKIQKLLRLSHSQNPHEAQAAALKAAQYQQEYNLGQNDFNEYDEELIYVCMALEAKKMTPKIEAIYDVMDLFLVKPIVHRSKGRTGIEIIGSALNVETADYMAKFLSFEYERLWQDFKKNQLTEKANANHRKSFFKGLSLGLRQKLEADQNIQGVGKELMVLKNQLTKQLHLVYPRLSKQSYGGKSLNSDALLAGNKASASLQLRKGLNRAKNILLLSGEKK